VGEVGEVRGGEGGERWWTVDGGVWVVRAAFRAGGEICGCGMGVG